MNQSVAKKAFTTQPQNYYLFLSDASCFRQRKGFRQTREQGRSMNFHVMNMK
jgi:hypothetical protein